MGPEPIVISRVITRFIYRGEKPCSYPIIRPFIRVTTPFTTGKGPGSRVFGEPAKVVFKKGNIDNVPNQPTGGI